MNSKRCPHISPILECLVGGKGTLVCHDEKFHETCEYKKKFVKSMKELNNFK